MRKFVREMAGKAKDELVKAGKSAKDRASGAKKYVRQKAVDAEKYVREKASDAEKVVRKKASDLGSKAKAKASDFKERAKASVEDLKNDPQFRKSVDDVKESFDSDVREKLNSGRYYAKDGTIKEKSLLHRAMDNPGKTALVASPAALSLALGGDEDEDDVMAEIKRKIRDDEPLTAAEKRLLRLMEE